jgi:hypothetical protein
MLDPVIKKQMATIAELQGKVAGLQKELKVAKAEKEELVDDYAVLKRRMESAKIPLRHISVRRKKDGSEWGVWGSVSSVVRKSKGMTCREIHELTGYDKYAIYAAARRYKVKLKPAN